MEKEASELAQAYFRRLTLENVRCFGIEQNLDFLKQDGSISLWNIIIGNNGVGKTTVLRSLASILLIGQERPIIESDYFNRKPNVDAKIKLELCPCDSKKFSIDKTPIVEIILKQKSRFSKPKSIVINFIRKGIELQTDVFGYGASRRISQTAISEDKSDFPIATLFDENASLLNAEEWLIESDYMAAKNKENHFIERKEKIVGILKRLFRGEIHNFKIDFESKRPKAKFLTDYGWVNLHDLSLGYKTLIAWMTDLASQMFEEYPDSSDPLAEPAVVLVDEIDLHLHPQFQRELTSFLTETFPKTQFIVTAHSPLILQSAPDANIILLKKEGDHVVVEQNPHEIKNWRIDQLLTSDLYGLPSDRPPQTEKKIERRRSLLKKDNRTKKEQAELEQLEEELVELPVG